MATDEGTPGQIPPQYAGTSRGIPGGESEHPIGQPVPNPAGPPTPFAGAQAPADPLSALTGDNRNAYSAISLELQQEGLGSLAPKLLEYLQQGFDQDTIALNLQNTQEWKTRFAGNEQRKANGFAELSVPDYLATEAQLLATSKAFGLPQGFYDNAADVAGLIGMNISPNEYQARAQHAWDFTLNADPASHQALQQFYGADASHAAAFFIDPTKAQSIIDKQAASATIGAIGIRNGVQGLGVNQAEQFYAQGVTAQQATGSLQSLGMVEPDLLSAAQRFGSGYDAQSALQDFVGGNAQAARERLNVSQEEQSLFSPTGGVVSGRPALGSF